MFMKRNYIDKSHSITDTSQPVSHLTPYATPSARAAARMTSAAFSLTI